MLADKRVVVSLVLAACALFLVLPFGRTVMNALFAPLERIVTISPQENNNNLNDLISENNSLKARLQSLGAEGTFESNGVVAEVIARTTNPYERILIVNRGADHGVRTSSVVVARGSLIGVAEKVESKRSFVRLLTDPDFKTIGRTVDGVEGIVAGRFGQIVFDKIPNNSGLVAGDAVLTSSLDNRMPPNLSIGVVAAIEKDETGLLLRALIDTNIDYENIGAVTILLGDS